MLPPHALEAAYTSSVMSGTQVVSGVDGKQASYWSVNVSPGGAPVHG
jgi:hypothetical protein